MFGRKNPSPHNHGDDSNWLYCDACGIYLGTIPMNRVPPEEERKSIEHCCMACAEYQDES